jgi:hypothetical protein
LPRIDPRLTRRKLPWPPYALLSRFLFANAEMEKFSPGHYDAHAAEDWSMACGLAGAASQPIFFSLISCYMIDAAT